jgi:hypothetical protein
MEEHTWKKRDKFRLRGEAWVIGSPDHIQANDKDVFEVQSVDRDGDLWSVCDGQPFCISPSEVTYFDTTPLIKEADPELERLLAEEAEIKSRFMPVEIEIAGRKWKEESRRVTDDETMTLTFKLQPMTMQDYQNIFWAEFDKDDGVATPFAKVRSGLAAVFDELGIKVPK